MTWSRVAYGRAPWAADEVPNVSPPGQQEPPGGGDAFAYTVDPGIAPYAYRSWAGAVPRSTYPGGGVTVTPDAESGVMRVDAWWPNASQVQLVRIGADGSRSPVRGAYPLHVSQATRQNLCTNPSFEASLAGWVALNGNTTLTRVAVAATRINLCTNPSAEVDVSGWSPRAASGSAITSVSQGSSAYVGTKSVTATAVASANGGITLPIGTGITAGSQYSVSAYVQGPAAGLTFNPFVDWLDAAGGYLSTSAGTPIFTGTTWARLSVTATAPANAAQVRPFITVSSMTSGQVVSVDAALYELGTLQSYFDGGSTYGASWTGTVGLSTSQLPDLTYVSSGSYAMRMTSTTTTTGALVPGVLSGTGAVTVAFGLRLASKPTSVTYSISWLTTGGTSAGSTVFTLTNDQLTASLTVGARHVFSAQAPTGAATGSGTLTLTGLTIGDAAELDAVTLEQGAVTDGSYFDGGSAGGTWTGTAHLSTSLSAPVLSVVDGEAPLDVALRYEAYNPSLLGGRMASPPTLLPSLDRTWLTHPASSSSPRVVQIAGPTPVRERAVEQGILYVLGRARPIVVSAAQRHADAGTLSIGALSRDELDELLTLFADLSPVLIRVPGGYDPPDMWVSLGALTIDPQGRLPWQETRVITSPYVEVDPPDATIT